MRERSRGDDRRQSTEASPSRLERRGVRREDENDRQEHEQLVGADPPTLCGELRAECDEHPCRCCQPQRKQLRCEHHEERDEGEVLGHGNKAHVENGHACSMHEPAKAVPERRGGLGPHDLPQHSDEGMLVENPRRGDLVLPERRRQGARQTERRRDDPERQRESCSWLDTSRPRPAGDRSGRWIPLLRQAVNVHVWPSGESRSWMFVRSA